MSGSQRVQDIIPIAERRRTSYENFVAECPLCGHECIFNRASDLCTFEPIAGLDVSCLNEKCGKPFRLVSDSVNERHEMLIFDCYELLERKQYMNCILNLALAYETFFSLFLRVELLYKPFAANPDQLDRLNRLSKKLENRIKTYTFHPMRTLFLWQITKQRSAATFDEAEETIKALKKKNKPTCSSLAGALDCMRPSMRKPAYPDRPPKDSEIETLSDAKLIPLLKALRDTTIHKLRNSVVHKQAYRPTREEVEDSLKETRSILFPLTYHLRLHDDPNGYMAHP